MNLNPLIQKHLDSLSSGAQTDDSQAAQPLSGLARMQQNINKPISCTICGGTWFTEATYAQYADMYSATPGGEFHQVSETSHSVRICLCGQVFQPNVGGMRGGRTPNAGLSSFIESLKSANVARSTMAALVQELASTAVSKEELAVLQAQLEQLSMPVLQLPDAPPAEDTTPKTAPKAKAKKPAEGPSNG